MKTENKELSEMSLKERMNLSQEDKEIKKQNQLLRKSLSDSKVFLTELQVELDELEDNLNDLLSSKVEDYSLKNIIEAKQKLEDCKEILKLSLHQFKIDFPNSQPFDEI